MRCLVDASVWIAATDPDNRSFYAARDFIADERVEMTALDLTMLEVINTAGRTGTPNLAEEAVQAVREGTSGRTRRLNDTDHERTMHLVRNNPLSAYDAAYVAAAVRDETQLVSLDLKDLVRPGWAMTPEQALELLSESD